MLRAGFTLLPAKTGYSRFDLQCGLRDRQPTYQISAGLQRRWYVDTPTWYDI